MAPVPDGLLRSLVDPVGDPAGLRQMFSRDAVPGSRPPTSVPSPLASAPSDALLDMLFNDARAEKPDGDQPRVGAHADEDAVPSEPSAETLLYPWHDPMEATEGVFGEVRAVSNSAQEAKRI